MRNLRDRSVPLLVLAAVAAILAQPTVATAFLGFVGGPPREPVAASRLAVLARDHALVALLGLLPALALGIALGIAVTRPSLKPLRPIADGLSALAQATPPVVVVALAFPVLGFGIAPTVLALAIYAIMPVYRASAAAFETLPPAILEAARALGMTPRQILVEIELPLARPLLADAFRIALLLGIATTAVGALAGAQTLGTPIVTGLQTQNEVTILQGAAATAALAFAADGLALILFARRGAEPQRSPLAGSAA
jgi:osmoprotectant transport system permease protein